MAEGGKNTSTENHSADSDDETDTSKTQEAGIEHDKVTTSQWLAGLFKKGLDLEDAPAREKVIPSLDITGVAEYIKSGKCKHIITMAGAGISTSAGIPDFRSPGSGLYDNLQKYNLPNPQAIFQIDFFEERPEPFFELAKNLWPGTFKPTPCHYFIKLLEDKGLLCRHYSQNIDTLEYVAGLHEDKLVLAHGSFHKAHCIRCQHEYTQEWIKDEIFADRIPTCTQENCGSFVKPDIVFFGEKLPSRFFDCVKEDLPHCDLLIIMGTSLAVQPFASLTSRVPEECPRLYINLENSAAQVDPIMAMFGMGQDFRFNQEDNYRDVFYQGTCDDGCQKLADELGWGDTLKAMVKTGHETIDESEKHSMKGEKPTKL